MKLTQLIPNIFYSDIQPGLNLFVKCLGFTVAHADTETARKFYILKRDSVTVHLLEDDEYAKKDRPEIRLETDHIEAFYQEIRSKDMHLFHPNLPEIKLQPWGLKEFALLDETGICVIVQQGSSA